MNEDPLIAGASRPSRTVAALARADDRLRRDFPCIALPVPILHGAADKATLPSGNPLFHETAGSADKTLKLYDGHFHDLLNEIGRDEVMADAQARIEARLPEPQRRIGFGGAGAPAPDPEGARIPALGRFRQVGGRPKRPV